MESYDQDNLFEPGFSVSNYFDLWARNFQGSVVPISYNAYNYILLKIQDPLNENFQYVLDDLINLAISGEKELFNFFFILVIHLRLFVDVNQSSQNLGQSF